MKREVSPNIQKICEVFEKAEKIEKVSDKQKNRVSELKSSFEKIEKTVKKGRKVLTKTEKKKLQTEEKKLGERLERWIVRGKSTVRGIKESEEQIKNSKLLDKNPATQNITRLQLCIKLENTELRNIICSYF